jgi:hypothetical protein
VARAQRRQYADHLSHHFFDRCVGSRSGAGGAHECRVRPAPCALVTCYPACWCPDVPIYWPSTLRRSSMSKIRCCFERTSRDGFAGFRLPGFGRHAARRADSSGASRQHGLLK